MKNQNLNYKELDFIRRIVITADKVNISNFEDRNFEVYFSHILNYPEYYSFSRILIALENTRNWSFLSVNVHGEIRYVPLPNDEQLELGETLEEECIEWNLNRYLQYQLPKTISPLAKLVGYANE